MISNKILFINVLNLYRIIPLLVCYFSEKDERNKIDMDIERWKKIKKIDSDNVQALLYFMIFMKEFRNLFLYRINKRKVWGRILKLFFIPLEGLYICTPKIGGGLFIQHGFSTIIAAKEIGQNCWINQQVTIGYTDDNACPIIGDNVCVYCGAKILGDIIVGDRSIIGAGAVVIRNVNSDSLAVGVPAKIKKKYGNEVL